MTNWSCLRLTILGWLLVYAGTAPAITQKALPSQDLDRNFQAAQADYDAGRYAESAKKLEALLPYGNKSYELHELLGLVYAELSEGDQALEQLQVAVHLKPDAAAAHTNLAAALFHGGENQLAGEQFRKALELAPNDYDANHNLGEFYIESGKIAEARPLLEKAQKINPASDGNGYDLAQAYLLTGEFARARQQVEVLLKQQNSGELHNLLGHIDEKDGKFLEAAKQYETAAHLDPSEENLFDWASEYLLHRTYEPAIEIFQQGSLRYPKSPRLLIGLGMSLYSRGKYDEAAKALVEAADLDPADARCYQFLSKAYESSPLQAEEVIQRFKRYAELQPNNALAQYYYAMSLWKGKDAEAAAVNLESIESLLRRSIALDDSLPDAHLQLGNLYSDQHQFARSYPEYKRAIELDPGLADAHYRLGQQYVRDGQKERAQEEFAVYQRLRAQRQAEIDKQEAEVQQFVYNATTTNAKSAPPNKF